MIGWRSVRFIAQDSAADCGLACLAMILDFYGWRGGLDALRGRLQPGNRGLTLADLMRYSVTMGLSGRAVALELRELPALRCPAILHWDHSHFVVLTNAGSRGVRIVDPARGYLEVSAGEVGRCFTGVALELEPGYEFQSARPRRTLRFRDLVFRTRRVAPALATLLVFGMILQSLALLAPMYTQAMLDSAIGSHNPDLPRLLFGVFAALTVLSILAEAARACLSLHLGARLQMAWRGSLFEHLLKLPLAFFEQRGVGDIQSRLRSMQTLETVTGQSATAAIVDGFMSVATIALLFFYSPMIAVAVLVCASTIISIKLAFLPARIQRSRDVLIAGAERDGFVLGCIRAITSVKTTAADHALVNRYRNALVEVVNRGLRLARLEVGLVAVTNAMARLTRLGAICLAAGLVLDGVLSTGALVAVIAYVAQFMDRVLMASDHLIAFRLARADLGRLETITAGAPEHTSESKLLVSEEPVSVEIDALGFRYAAGEPWLLRRISLAVQAGEHVVITGPSGCGKSTLLKLLGGLYPAVEGRIAIAGHWLERERLLELRRHCATVLQDDCLLPGTIIENISAFAVNPDPGRLQRVAAIADLDAVIARLPLGLHTPLTDLGYGLSGGQRQRILLARALYRNPAILLLDEATSHLDAASERRIYKNLRSLGLTVIAVAHRSISIASADRVLALDVGVVTSLTDKSGDTIVKV